MLSSKSFQALLLPLSLAATLSCSPTNLPPIGSEATSFQAEEDEKSLWQADEQFLKRLEKAGLFYEDRELEAYLVAVAERLLAGKLQGTRLAPRVKVVKDPFLNAVALANGAILFHAGLLARMENEAQMATILGHELTHFVQRHALKNQRHAENKVIAARMLQVMLITVPFGPLAEQLPTVWAAASISGYSKELETEADEGGLRYLVEAGYDPKESIKAFDTLKQSLEEAKLKEPYFFGTHPRVEERIENHLRLLKGEYQRAANEPGRRQNAEEYLSRIHQLLLDNAMLDLNLGRLKTARAAIEKHLSRDAKSAKGHFTFGELQRRSGEAEKAEKSYREAARLDATYAEPHRELGLLYRAENKPGEARAEFEQYLQLNPKAVDAGIIRGHIAELSKP
jgi:predicted Zn-dependent protease